MFRLKATSPSGEEFFLKTGAYRLGSAWDSEMVLKDESVAEYHCEVVVTAKTITVRNLSSDHQTFINEESIHTAQLNVGQSLRIGEVTLVLEEAGTEAAGAGMAGGAEGAAVAASKSVSSRLLEKYGMPLVVLLGVAAIAALVLANRSTAAKKAAEIAAAKKAKPAVKVEAAQAGKSASASKKQTEKGADTDEQSASPSPGGKQAGPEHPKQESGEHLKQVGRPLDESEEMAQSIKKGDELLRKGDYAEAESVLAQLLRKQTALHGVDHPEVTRTLTSLGEARTRTGRHLQAEADLQQALRNAESSHGAEDPKTAAVLGRLGALYVAAGEHGSAGPFLQRALAIQQKPPAASAVEVASTLNTMAALKAAGGDLAGAIPLLEGSVSSLERATASTNPAVLQAMDQLAEAHLKMGSLEKAEQILQQNLKRKGETLGGDDPRMATTLDALAELRQAQGNAAQADEHLTKALEITEKSLGVDHPETSRRASALAELKRTQGETSQAEALLRRAGDSLNKTLGPEHPETVMNLARRAALRGCEGGEPELIDQALRSRMGLLNSLVSYGTTEQRISYRERVNPYALAVSLHNPTEIASAMLRYKGVILDSLLEDRVLAREHLDSESRSLFENWVGVRAELAGRLFAVPDDSTPKAKAERESLTRALTNKLVLVEAELSRHVPEVGRARRGLRVAVEEVQGRMPQGMALVELARYSRCVSSNRWEIGYGAVVISAGGEPVLVELAGAAAVEKDLEQLQQVLAGGSRSIAEGGNARTELKPEARPGEGNGGGEVSAIPPLPALLQGLHRQVWAPIEAALPGGTKTVVVSPDAMLSFLSFATLLGPNDQFVCEKYSLRYVSTGRDLVERTVPTANGSIVVLGNPNFAEPAPGRAEGSILTNVLKDADRRDLRKLSLPQLSASVEQASVLEFLFKKWNWPVVGMFGEKASEQELMAIQSPRIAHLATWGFFLPATALAKGDVGFSKSFPEAKVEPGGRMLAEAAKLLAGFEPARNPVHRAGLVLAGARGAIQVWNAGGGTDASTDGVLTADELATLNLRGTELVVLSAAEAPAPSLQAAEGLLGLRRAFVRAGAQNLLMPLLSVSDEETSPMMVDFYGRLLGGGPVASSFAGLQTDWLIRLRKERGLKTAVRLAGAYVMSSQGSIQ